MPKKLPFIILLGIVLLSGGGCAALRGGGAAAGTVAYVMGELRSMEEASLERTWEAAQKTMEDLEFIVTSKQKDVLTARLIARGANDKKIVIQLKKVSEDLTEVRIRVGTFGDESLSRQILERLKKNLGIGSDAAAAGTAAYTLGELRSMEQVSLDRTWQAAQKAVEDLEYTVTSREKDALAANLIARGAGDKKIEINLRKVSEEMTEVRIRVGTFGDESLSRLVLKRIKKNLFF
ncbi:hypothetical protein KSU1_D0541 [Candidatus Jettenia caeni]|uniref:Lipoprotein n=2 Tax=Candidatus Jettenia TaxID=360731 RepID=I3IQ55_9BACT|nr:DUF3568 family protein [Candidatus Jettenia sp. AMX1]NUN22481.1 DUF3568 family protein [Candidatus Jettenia caeni]TLD41386.1 MAG: hypothetical protein JETT_2343 [Candidatus Jettenia ecosi]WKZ15166.1 MAG: DUF3568 family protein [Candidatus Jettenia caeni]GAB63850.1 hypothetical protein KSU1_D0541 [Candidatus Jettenia caeni]GIL20321.1 MAG: hypothetical protein BroJett041_14350 [Candidatus Jettenia caeni]